MDNLSSQDTETCGASVHRLHVAFGHSDILGMVDSLRKRKSSSHSSCSCKVNEVWCWSGHRMVVTSTGSKWKTCRTWSGAADGHFLLETTHVRDSQKVHLTVLFEVERALVTSHPYSKNNISRVLDQVLRASDGGAARSGRLCS